MSFAGDIYSFGGLQIAVLFVAPPFLYVIAGALYNIFFHPLSTFPGPTLWASSRLPYSYENLKGQLVYKTTELHEKYGPVVRIGPDELSFATATAWKTIYGHRPSEMPKSIAGHSHVPRNGGAVSILTAPKADHARIRRSIAHAFSDKALREQEHYLQDYVNILITQLRRNASTGPLDMVEWYNFTTFDAIGDLAFGEPFGCLEDNAYHPWIAFIFSGVVKALPIAQTLHYYGLSWLLKYIAPKKMTNATAEHSRLAAEKTDRRLAKGINEERKDFFTYILKNRDQEALSSRELHDLSVVLIVGGSETTATLLSAATYFLLADRRKYCKLAKEIRQTFKSEKDITLVTVGELKYLLAVLDESLRLFPPAPASFPRVVQKPGETIDGFFVPAGNVVGCNIYATSHYSKNFKKPNQFIPERFNPGTKEEEAEFAGDSKGASQPFSVGPRNCIGRTLAYAEMRLIMARLLFNFDLELAPGSESWGAAQKAYLVWEKGPLMVKLTPIWKG